MLPASAEPKVTEWATRKNYPIQYDAHFVPANLDYKLVKFNPNFSSANPGYQALLPDLPTGFLFGYGTNNEEDEGSNDDDTPTKIRAQETKVTA